MARFSANLTDSSASEDEEERVHSPPTLLDVTAAPSKAKSKPQPASDSEEDESSDEILDSEDDSGNDSGNDSESGSEMQEDELMKSSPVRRRALAKTQNALVEDEDGEFRYAHELNGSGTDRRNSKTSPTRGIRGDPTIIPWAQQVGVDAQKMHVMQTSLFRMPEEAAAMSSNSNLKVKSTTRTLQLALPQPISRKHSRDSEGDGLRMDSRERASFAHGVDPLPYRPSRKYARVEGSASSVIGSEGAAVDAGLAMGRSFRVGWGPGGTLVHLGSLCKPSGTLKISANSSIINKTTIPIFPLQPVDESTRLLVLLSHHLAHTPIILDADRVPFANPAPSLRFDSFTSLYAPSNRSYEAALYRLGHALFDDIELGLGDEITIDIQNRVKSIRRKAALSVWLEDAVASSVDASLKAASSSSNSAAFTLLTGHQIEKACEAAIDVGNIKLATLIAQGSGDFEFRDDLRAQLEIWREEKVDVHIDEGIRKVYALLAGEVDIVEGSKGTGLEKCKDVDIFEGLDWKRAFGIHLWFSESLDTPIAAIFESYDRQRMKETGRVMGPKPWYFEYPPPPSAIAHTWNLPPASSTPDALYSLIRLHADPTCSLSQTLTPLSFGPSPVDYSLPWHLYIMLSRCMGVRDFADREDPGALATRHGSDGSVEDEEVEGHSPSADLLASSYALQLENLGLLQEAVFVLLHIEGSAGREKAIKDLLGRQAAKLDDWTMRGLCGSLKIPISWVNEAKAIYALDQGKVYEAYEHYLSAQLYNPAHELAVLELAPEAVIHKDLDLLKDIFERFLGRKVENWILRGKVFLDYAHILTRLPELQAHMADTNAVSDASQSSEMDELTRAIPKLVEILPDVLRNRDDPRHNVALAEMIAGLIVTLDRVKPLALSQTQVRPSLVDDGTKLRHIHSTAYERFLRTIEVANS